MENSEVELRRKIFRVTVVCLIQRRVYSRYRDVQCGTGRRDVVRTTPRLQRIGQYTTDSQMRYAVCLPIDGQIGLNDLEPQICITTNPDTVLPILVECKNVATVNIPPKMAASSVISVKVC